MARRGTTPEYALSIHGYNLKEYSVYVTIAQYSRKRTLDRERLRITYDSDKDLSTVWFRLTQEETLAMKSGSAEVQVRFVDADGNARATEIGSIQILPVLLEDVIEYDGED